MSDCIVCIDLYIWITEMSVDVIELNTLLFALDNKAYKQRFPFQFWDSGDERVPYYIYLI